MTAVPAEIEDCSPDSCMFRGMQNLDKVMDGLTLHEASILVAEADDLQARHDEYVNACFQNETVDENNLQASHQAY